MNYRDLEIWQLSRTLTVDIHRMTLQNLPKFEAFEEGSQIRRSMKSVKSNIVEGYGRRRYKQDFIRFLTYAHASCDETIDHLETLGAKLNRFIRGVESSHQSVREEPTPYEVNP